MLNQKIQLMFSNNPNLDLEFVVEELQSYTEQELKLATDIHTGDSYVCIEENGGYKIYDPEVLDWFEYTGEDKDSFKLSTSAVNEVDEDKIIIMQKISNHFAKKMKEEVSKEVNVRSTPIFFDPKTYFKYLLEDNMKENRFVYSEYFTNDTVEKSEVPSEYKYLWEKAKDFYDSNYEVAIKKAKGRR